MFHFSILGNMIKRNIGNSPEYFDSTEVIILTGKFPELLHSITNVLSVGSS